MQAAGPAEQNTEGPTHEILHPANWARARGYANGVAASGRMVFLGGQVGWNAAQEFETDDFAGQVRQALENIVTVLAEAGAQPHHLVRLTWFVTDREEYLRSLKEVGAAYRDVIGRHYPAMTLAEVRALAEPRAKVEIEATAVVPG
ncbi:MAG: RidA family protein [Alphaproteobacteria bacterium]